MLRSIGSEPDNSPVEIEWSARRGEKIALRVEGQAREISTETCERALLPCRRKPNDVFNISKGVDHEQIARAVEGKGSRGVQVGSKSGPDAIRSEFYDRIGSSLRHKEITYPIERQVTWGHYVRNKDASAPSGSEFQYLIALQLRNMEVVGRALQL